ncbi:MAG: sulfite exporter TauE/SafE family protein [Clostridia bacterium]|nr:sulfite exporter TauE/SafE family protein [Clostridia bacterium]
MADERSKNWQRGVCGALVGAANSLFGGGGGMIAVPLLTKVGLQEKQAHATAILVILPISLFSFFLYALRGYCSLSVLLPTSIGVTAGGAVGAGLLGKLQTKTVNLIFAALQVLAGIFLIFFRS